MKYPKEILEAAAQVMHYLGVEPSGDQLLSVSIPPDLAAEAAKLPKGPTPMALMLLWNESKHPRLKACSKLTEARRRHCSARLREFPDREKWEALIHWINNDQWALGLRPNPKFPNWRADFDWMIRPGTMVRFIEGGYHAGAAATSARDKYSDEIDERS